MAGKHSRGSRVGLILGLIGIAAIAPIVSGVDADWAMAAAFIGLVLALTGFITFFMLRQSERIAAEFFTEEQLIADWHLQEDDEHMEIYSKGLVYENEMFVNEASISTLEGAGFHPVDQGKFVFLYLVMGRHASSRRRAIIVSIPKGENANAEHIASVYNKPLPRDFIDRLKSDAGLDEQEQEEDSD